MSFSSHHRRSSRSRSGKSTLASTCLNISKTSACRCVGRCTADATKKPPPHRDESCALPAVPPWCSTPTLSRGVALGSPGGAFASPGRPCNGGRVRRRLPLRLPASDSGRGSGVIFGAALRVRSHRGPKFVGPARTRCASASRLLVSVFAFVHFAGRCPFVGRSVGLEDRAGRHVVSIPMCAVLIRAVRSATLHHRPVGRERQANRFGDRFPCHQPHTSRPPCSSSWPSWRRTTTASGSMRTRRGTSETSVTRLVSVRIGDFRRQVI